MLYGKKENYQVLAGDFHSRFEDLDFVLFSLRHLSPGMRLFSETLEWDIRLLLFENYLNLLIFPVTHPSTNRDGWCLTSDFWLPTAYLLLLLRHVRHTVLTLNRWYKHKLEYLWVFFWDMRNYVLVLKFRIWIFVTNEDFYETWGFSYVYWETFVGLLFEI